MAYITIPPEEWSAFCREFSRQHRGWLASIGVISTKVLDADPQAADARMTPVATEAPLQEITIEHNDHREVVLIAGQEPGQVSHRVSRPTNLAMTQTDNGAHEGLRIDADDGRTTLVRFRAAAEPESLDGTLVATP